MFFFFKAPFLALSLEMSITPSTSSTSAVCVIFTQVLGYPAILSHEIEIKALDGCDRLEVRKDEKKQRLGKGAKLVGTSSIENFWTK